MVWLRHVILKALVSSHGKENQVLLVKLVPLGQELWEKKYFIMLVFTKCICKRASLEFSREIITKGQLGGQQLDKGIQ